MAQPALSIPVQVRVIKVNVLNIFRISWQRIPLFAKKDMHVVFPVVVKRG